MHTFSNFEQQSFHFINCSAPYELVRRGRIAGQDPSSGLNYSSHLSSIKGQWSAFIGVRVKLPSEARLGSYLLFWSPVEGGGGGGVLIQQLHQLRVYMCQLRSWNDANKTDKTVWMTNCSFIYRQLLLTVVCRNCFWVMLNIPVLPYHDILHSIAW